MESGAYLILEGDSSTAESFGFRPTKDNVKVASIADVHAPKLGIVWEKGLELPRYEIPAEAQIFAKERWTGAPLIAGFRRGSGAVLWVAAPPGERGYERFPYLLQALPIWASTRRSAPRACGPSSIRPTACAWIWIISPHAGATPASRRCMWPPGISRMPIPSATPICSA